MKIVYVDDNRCRGNYGCRATSTALSQIITASGNEIVGRISGKYTNFDTGNLVFNKNYSKGFYKRLGTKKHLKEFKKLIYMYHRFKKRGKFYFSKYDFINYDFDISIENLIKCLPANPELQEYDLRQYDFDALVVNGEGSFIFSTPAWRECLIEAMLMHWAIKMNKKVYYLNGMLSDDPYSKHNEKTIDLIKPLFEKAEVVSVREEFSYDYAKKHFKKCNLYQYPDALFTWYPYVNDSFKVLDGKYFIGMSNATDESYYKYDFSKDYICVSGSSAAGLASKNEDDLINTYVKLVNSIKNNIKMPIYLVEVCEGDAFLRKVAIKTNCELIPLDTPILAAAKILANARLYISGRYHPSIMASLGGTPCIFMSSNSHKTKSLQALLKYKEIKEFNVLPTNKEVNEIIALGIEYLNDSNIRRKIKKQCEKLYQMAKKQGELLKNE